MSRQNKISCFVGDRGTGKTPVIIGDAQYGVRSLAQLYVEKGYRVFIIDTIANTKYNGKVTDLKPGTDLAKLSTGIYRIVITLEAFPVLLQLINKAGIKIAIFFEDSFRYISKQVDTGTISLLLDSKQRDIDTFFLYHAWGWIPKDLFRIIDIFEVFKSAEHPNVRKAELSGKYDQVLTAYNRAMASDNPYYHETVLD
jgi:hypothetical protein